MSESVNNKTAYLTTMRGFFAWWVVLYHSRELVDSYLPAALITLFSKGFLAVDFFFVLSGFVIHLNHANDFFPLHRNSISTFAIKRFARIYPLHLATLLLYLSVPLAIFLVRPEAQISSQFSVSSFLQNLLLVQNWGFSDHLTWNFPAWSISSEFAAYLVYPALAIFMARTPNHIRRDIALIFFSLSVIALIFSIGQAQSLGDDITTYGTIRCLLEFFSGCLLCQIYKRGKRVGAFGLVFVVITGLSGLVLLSQTHIADYFIAPGLIVLFLYFLNETADLKPMAFTWLNLPVLKALGEISYSTYLVHALVLQWFKFLVVDANQVLSPIWYMAYLVSVLVLSIVFYRLVEVRGKKFILRVADRALSAR